MKKESKVDELCMTLEGLTGTFPAKLIQALIDVASDYSNELYLVGGTVRDWLLGKKAKDLDVTIPVDVEPFCRDLITRLGGGTYVQLGTEEEEAARIVWRGVETDVSSFRGTAKNIEEDLALRDFTINSIAVDCIALGVGNPVEVIDPLCGVKDLQKKIIRYCPGAFKADPLRLLRAYRFAALLGFTPDSETVTEIRNWSGTIRNVASERVSYELDLILGADNGAAQFWKMHEDGLLAELIPELYDGTGVEQPKFHHLDVFHHNFQALFEMEKLLDDPGAVYPACSTEVDDYLSSGNVKTSLKWAALLHDLGKPAVKGISATDPERATFYGHDEIGRRIGEKVGRRLKWSNDERERVTSLIGMHMHPFHISSIHREAKLTKRAALKLCKRAGDELPGLFLLAMSDSLAGKGEQKPADMEDLLVSLYHDVAEIYRQHIKPVLSAPPLLNGKDLIGIFKLKPGPVFRVILDELLARQVDGSISTKEDAIAWVKEFTDENKDKIELIPV